MKLSDIDHWVGEITSTIIGLHERIHKDDGFYKTSEDTECQEEIDALEKIAELARQQLMNKPEG